ncbi:MAG: hypothetical protein JO198_09550 [Candidatus Dormibacteraeota bacterium]|nr:hypothetical protein [Candidatus Dormibacteraeota bacterium]
MQGLRAHLHGLRIKVGLGFAGAITGAALLPAAVSAPATALSTTAQVARHYAPTAAQTQLAGAGWSAPTAVLTGAGWSAPVAGGGSGSGWGGSGGPGPRPDGAGWS